MPDETPAPEEDEPSFSILPIVNGLASRYYQPIAHIVEWPWKLFCAEWALLIDAAREDELRRQQREREREQQRLADAHTAHWQ